MTSSPAPARAPAPLRSLDDALATLLAHATPLPQHERVSTFDADARVLAHDVVSDLHVPPQDNSSMDGYAVRCADFTNADNSLPSNVAASLPISLPISQRIPAGSVGQPLAPNSVARIFTGAPIPQGADAVVMQEDVEAQAGDPPAMQLAHFKVRPQAGQWIRRAGEDVSRGSVVLSRGARLTPQALGLAASVGMGHLEVAPKPRVALFSTGDELVMPGDVAPADMRPGSIYNSNRFFMRALLTRLGCTVTDYGVVADQRQATIDALQSAAGGHDLILTCGGVSVGEEDHIKPAVQTLGTLDLWQIAIKPGKPFAYGQIGNTHFIGLPGNPVSSLVTFLLLVRPFVLRLQGSTDIAPRSVALRADFSWARADKRREFLRARRNAEGRA